MGDFWFDAGGGGVWSGKLIGNFDIASLVCLVRCGWCGWWVAGLERLEDGGGMKSEYSVGVKGRLDGEMGWGTRRGGMMVMVK